MKRIRKLHDLVPYGLFGRTVLIILLPILLLQILATYIFFDRHWTRMTERLAFSVAGEIAAISEVIENKNEDKFYVEDFKKLMAKHMDVLITFSPKKYRDDLQAEAGGGPGLENTLERAISEQVRRPFDVNIDLSRKRVDVDVQLKNGLLHASMPQRRMYDSSGYIFVLWLNGLAFLFFLVSIVFMRNQIRPIHRLAVAAERFGKGVDVQRLFLI
jgi:two-component system, OmpR family, osmolarity sensor histidine kinase EnvZ